jgi:hypothetical protein
MVISVSRLGREKAVEASNVYAWKAFSPGPDAIDDVGEKVEAWGPESRSFGYLRRFHLCA